MPAPRYWLLNFRPETYEIVKSAGTIGVLDCHRRRFAAMAEGDLFVVYVSRQRVFDGHGRIAGAPFADTTPLFGAGKLYPWRAPVTFSQTGRALPGDDLLWGLSVWPDPMKTSPTNYLFCYGGFMEITETDYKAVLDALSAGAGPGT